jgi:hypothetical protein
MFILWPVGLSFWVFTSLKLWMARVMVDVYNMDSDLGAEYDESRRGSGVLERGRRDIWDDWDSEEG